MSKTQRIFRNLVLLLFILPFMGSCGKAGKTIVKDHFKKDAGGWTIVGDAKGDSAEPQYVKKGGVSNGYIFAEDDVAGGVWYFAASERYLGNQSRFYGATLKFSLFQDSKRSSQFNEKDLIIECGDLQMYHRIAPFPDTVWTNYEVPIAGNSGWRTGNNQEAGEDEVKEILKNITAFWIRGEFESGPDSGGLDAVEIIQ